MLKKYGIIKKISSEISNAANEVAMDVLNDYSDLKGREEEITGQLRGEINRRLLEKIKEKLNDKKINGCKISIATFKKIQESKVGADFAGIIEISNGDIEISKAFLAQAKVGTASEDDHTDEVFEAENPDILKQANKMLEVSSDSFIFIYTKSGIACVPAFQVQLAGVNKITTKDFPYRKFDSFFEEFFKCFIGDHKISPKAIGATSLEDYAEKMALNSTFKIRVDLPKQFV